MVKVTFCPAVQGILIWVFVELLKLMLLDLLHDPKPQAPFQPEDVLHTCNSSVLALFPRAIVVAVTPFAMVMVDVELGDADKVFAVKLQLFASPGKVTFWDEPLSIKTMVRVPLLVETVYDALATELVLYPDSTAIAFTVSEALTETVAEEEPAVPLVLAVVGVEPSVA